jgi:Tfp pilus assembly protein PilN
MRWHCSRITALVLSALFAAACNGTSHAREQRELQDLETEIDHILDRPRDDWNGILDRIRRQNPDSQRVREVRDFCVSAYEKYREALAGLERTKQRVAALETAIGQGNLLAAARNRDAAEQSMNETDRVLADAEIQVKACARKKNELRSRMASSN